MGPEILLLGSLILGGFGFFSLCLLYACHRWTYGCRRELREIKALLANRTDR